ncbi:MAG: hypothetical protein JNK45_18395 [Myxococcales bacterium]|nr:hypothetical protein [Myxococcales bacterium]
MTDVPAGAPPSWAGRGLRLVGWIALCIAPLVVRVACEASGELDAAAAARGVGDGDGEVLHLGRALRWRLPLATHDERAIARLLEIGEQAAGPDPALSLAAYREIRSALLGSRGLDVPHADVLADVDARIAAAMADGDAAAEAARRAELDREPGRSRMGPALAAAGWIAWAWATARFVRRGLDARGRVVPGVGTRAGLLALALLVAWVVAWRFA